MPPMKTSIKHDKLDIIIWDIEKKLRIVAEISDPTDVNVKQN